MRVFFTYTRAIVDSSRLCDAYIYMSVNSSYHHPSSAKTLSKSMLTHCWLDLVNIYCSEKIPIVLGVVDLDHQDQIWHQTDTNGAQFSLFIPICEIYFLTRPVLAWGYCRCLRLCVRTCQSVCQSIACPRDNSAPVQVRITKFGPKVQNN